MAEENLITAKDQDGNILVGNKKLWEKLRGILESDATWCCGEGDYDREAELMEHADEINKLIRKIPS